MPDEKPELFRVPATPEDAADAIRDYVEKINIIAGFLHQSGFQIEIDSQSFTLTRRFPHPGESSFNQFSVEISKKLTL